MGPRTLISGGLAGGGGPGDICAYQVGKGRTLAEFEGTPLVIEVRYDHRPGVSAAGGGDACGAVGICW